MKLTDIWHFHRPALAKVYLDMLNAGMVTSTTIFAPRRAGKTSFLLKDLMPAAQDAGYIVVYADLWQTKLSPGVSTVRALEAALEPKGRRGNCALHHEGAWTALDATQKALVRMLAADPSLKPFSRDVFAKLRIALGVENLAATHVQRAMTKLSGIVVKSPRDTYEFENENFAQWVRTLAD